MAEKIIIPDLGHIVRQVIIDRWLKKEGDWVEKGEVLLEVTTDKAAVEVESFASGVLRKILFHEGETVQMGAVIALIAGPDEELPEIPLPPNMAAGACPEPVEGVKEPNALIPKTAGQGEAERIKASPLAKRLAKEQGIDLVMVEGTGPGGLITKEDLPPGRLGLRCCRKKP